MIPVGIRDPDDGAPRPQQPRRRFGLDAPLPADPWVIERAVLRHIASCRPEAVVFPLSRMPRSDTPAGRDRVDLAAGVPELMVMLPGGRLAFLVIKTQARDLTRAERAFADLCRARAVPVHIVRSLPEARQALDRLGLSSRPETPHAAEEEGVARRPAGPRRS